MNTTVCAATDAVKQWTDIDWKKAEYYVKKTTDSYCEGLQRRQTQQSEIFAVDADTLFLCQSTGNKKSYFK